MWILVLCRLSNICLPDTRLCLRQELRVAQGLPIGSQVFVSSLVLGCWDANN